MPDAVQTLQRAELREIVSAPIGVADVPAQERSALRKFRSWKRFHHGPRKQAAPLLGLLPRYVDCVLVAGCQRSGTTMLTRVIARSQGFRSFALTHDDELDAALILSGHITLPVGPRYCFQTTYLNERYGEYALMRPDQRLIWVLRNPYSVVYSMLYNWKRFALNELYDSCAATGTESRPWPFGLSIARKACLAYAAKTAQIMTIRRLVQPHQILVVEYDQIVSAPNEWLPRIFGFVGEPYHSTYSAAVRADSLAKAKRMPSRLTQLVEQLAAPTYGECLKLVTNGNRSTL
jgi:hypothetical protein